MKIPIKIIFFTISLIILNCIVSFLLLPYLQFETNKHSGIADYFVLIFVAVSIALLVYILFKISTKAIRPIEIFILGLFFVTFIYWGIKFIQLECYNCSIL